MVMATALCADRSAIAKVAPVDARPLSSQSFAARLTRSLQRTVPVVRIEALRGNESVQAPALPIRDAASGKRQCSPSPFQFRLPPPSL